MQAAFTPSKICVVRVPGQMTAGKVRASAPTVPEDQPLLPCATVNEDPSDPPHEKPAEGVEEAADKPANGQDDSASKKQQEEQQQAVMTLIQGVAIGQAKGGCWSIKQASILNSVVKQLTGSGEPSALPAFDPSETPAEGLPPQQRCVIYLIQAVGFGQAKGAFNLEQAAILDSAIDVLTSENKSA